MANARTARKPRKPRRPGRPRADDGNQRERLLDSALAAFAAEGIGATSLRGIAAKAGVTPALVNYYFGSKEQLVDAFVAERVVPAVGALRERLLAAGSHPHALATAFVHGIHDIVERYPWWPALWVREVLSDNGALRGLMQSLIGPQVAQLLASSLGAARERGELPADLDPRLLVVSLIGLTMLPLAAEPLWRRALRAADIDRAMLLRHTLALLSHGIGDRDAT
jgi:TetR/AcrR family transcriptional regulator